MNLWKTIPGGYDDAPTIEYFPAELKKSDGAVIIFPGGGYHHLAAHEGAGYAKMLNFFGIDAFVVKYRLAPYSYPTQIMDARRAVQFVRYHKDTYNINPDKIAVMGSSAGGHLAALVATYKEEAKPEITDEIDAMDFLPNFQILVYPVLDFYEKKLMHEGSRLAFMGEAANDDEFAKRLSPNRIADETAPPAFIWHNFDDNTVPVLGVLDYVKKLKECKVDVELHIFPHGDHGPGAATGMHSEGWTYMLKRWFYEMNFMK